MAKILLRRKYQEQRVKVPADAPLTPKEQKFVAEYIKTSSCILAMRNAEINNVDENGKKVTPQGILNRPNVQAEIRRIMDDIRKDGIAEASEVMEYFTSVMRGEIKDQFGLDAPLAERTRAAQELAKRTVDIETKQAGIPDQTIAIKLDWSRKEE